MVQLKPIFSYTGVKRSKLKPTWFRRSHSFAITDRSNPFIVPTLKLPCLRSVITSNLSDVTLPLRPVTIRWSEVGTSNYWNLSSRKKTQSLSWAWSNLGGRSDTKMVPSFMFLLTIKQTREQFHSWDYTSRRSSVCTCSKHFINEGECVLLLFYRKYLYQRNRLFSFEVFIKYGPSKDRYPIAWRTGMLSKL